MLLPAQFALSASVLSHCKGYDMGTHVHYSYEVLPRQAGGWRLRLLEDGEEVGGAAIPLDDDPEHGVTWWNELTEEIRAHWLAVAGSAVPADAWRAYQLEEGQLDAVGEGEAWLSTRD